MRRWVAPSVRLRWPLLLADCLAVCVRAGGALEAVSTPVSVGCILLASRFSISPTPVRILIESLHHFSDRPAPRRLPHTQALPSFCSALRSAAARGPRRLAAAPHQPRRRQQWRPGAAAHTHRLCGLVCADRRAGAAGSWASVRCFIESFVYRPLLCLLATGRCFIDRWLHSGPLCILATSISHNGAHCP